jgi:plasmid stabilization system protein ParE
MRFHVHEAARAEAVVGAAYYETRCAGLGEAFTQLVEEAFRQVARHPQRFARLETTPLEGEIRRFLLRRFPYVVIYEVRPDLIEVLAIAHASQAPDYWLTRDDS